MTRPAKRPTSTDVARAAGVSQTTVSFVLNDRPGQSISEATRRRVLDAAQGLGYRPHASARTLAAGRSDIVLLSVPDLPVGASINRMIEELAVSLAEHGLTLVTHLVSAHGRPLPEVCASVDASAVLGFEPFDQDTVEALRRLGVTVVPPANVDHSLAMRPIGRLQADHLISRGHQRIGYALPEHPGFRRMAEDRLRGVMDACTDLGLAPPVVLSTSLEIAAAARAVTGWMSESVTGVCAFNDDTAMAVLAGLREQGLTAPADLAVIGADDIPTSPLTAPPLTSIRFDLHEVGRRRAEAVIAGLSGREPHLTFASVNPQVVQRSST
ncbi:LacI family transcriptional regulator [Streptomyces sp. NBC_01537]|uniref:LacI family DNA-binding transcriptional regulator n=1 Tax=Streptomyces sp. NBC_01537 TaxID=2903896 RepID=UPI00386EC3C4